MDLNPLHWITIDYIKFLFSFLLICACLVGAAPLCRTVPLFFFVGLVFLRPCLYSFIFFSMKLLLLSKNKSVLSYSGNYFCFQFKSFLIVFFKFKRKMTRIPHTVPPVWIIACFFYENDFPWEKKMKEYRGTQKNQSTKTP